MENLNYNEKQKIKLIIKELQTFLDYGYYNANYTEDDFFNQNLKEILKGQIYKNNKIKFVVNKEKKTIQDLKKMYNREILNNGELCDISFFGFFDIITEGEVY